MHWFWHAKTSRAKTKVKVDFHLDGVGFEVLQGSQISGEFELGTYYYVMQLANPLIQLEICDS